MRRFAIALLAAAVACTSGSRSSTPTPTPTPNPNPADLLPALAPDGTIVVAWEIPLEPGAIVRGPLLLDAGGNLYWSEEYPTGDEARMQQVVSTTSAGSPRFRVQMRPRAPGYDLLSPDPITAGEVIVMREIFSETSWGAQGVVAVRASDGAEAWTRRLDDERCLALIGAISASADAVLVSADRLCDDAIVHLVESLDLASGTPRWSVEASGTAYVDEQGRVFLLHWGGAEDEMVALSAAGDVLWTRPGSGAAWRSATGTGALSADDGVHDAASGTLRIALKASARTPILASGEMVWIDALDTRYPVRMKRQALDGASPEWDIVLAEPFPEGNSGKAWTSFTWPVLTDAGTLLVIEHQWSLYDPAHNASWLREIRLSDGSDVFRLRLPATDGAYGGDQSFALGDGRVFVDVSREDGTPLIRAFDVPGRRPAAYGWVTLGGSMARDRRAR